MPPKQQQQSRTSRTNSRGSTRGWGYSISMLLSIVISIAAVIVACYFGAYIHEYRSNSSHQQGQDGKVNIDGMRVQEEHVSWSTNSNAAARCDISTLDVKMLTDVEYDALKLSSDPILIRNAMHGWRAKHRWSLPMFMENYGNATVQIAASIELEGSRLTHVSSKNESIYGYMLKEIFEYWSNNPSDVALGEQIHSYDFLQNIPEMGRDFIVPKILKPLYIHKAVRHWDNSENARAQLVRHYLSIVPNRAGILLRSLDGPFWFGLVEGERTWYLYPPDSSLHYGEDPLAGAYQWALNLKSEVVGEPYICTQRRGEMLLLPEGWTYAFVSSGISGGIGGEFTKSLETRVSEVETVPLSERSSFFSLLAAGRTLEEAAYKDIAAAKKRHKATKTGVAKLRSEVGYFLKDLSHSEDIWLVNFYSANCATCQEFSKIWQEVGLQMVGIASVGVVDVSDPSKVGGISESWRNYGILNVPSVVIFQGGRREVRSHQHFLEEDSLVSFHGAVILPSSEADSSYSSHLLTAEEVMNATLITLEALKTTGGYRGSVSESTARSRRYRHLALAYLQQADAIRRNHPEVVLLIARILGPGLKDPVGSKSILTSYKEYLISTVFSADGKLVPTRTVAVVFHALGQLYHSLKAYQLAVDMLRRAIEVDTKYLAPIFDLAQVHSKTKNDEAATEVMAQLLRN